MGQVLLASKAPSIDSNQQTLSKRQPPLPTQAGANALSPPTRSGGGLIFPREMTGEELHEARGLISRTGQDAHAVLDVLTAAIQTGEIRVFADVDADTSYHCRNRGEVLSIRSGYHYEK